MTDVITSITGRTCLVSRPARWAGQGVNLICIIIHVSICIGGCNKKKERPVSRGGSGVRLGFKGHSDSCMVVRSCRLWFHRISHTWNASRSALVVHPFT